MVNAYILNVGQGNMVVIVFPDNYVIVYDCNITTDLESDIFHFLANIIPKRSIDIFINSHRDSDHMRGIKKLHNVYPIGLILDSDVSGNTETDEYKEYMEMRRKIGFEIVTPGTHLRNKKYVKFLNGKREGLNDSNSQSIITHINYGGSSLLLAGDTDCSSWKDYIMHESKSTISSLVLCASHHGSFSFFNKNRESDQDYVEHLNTIYPAICVISVGPNNHGHPDSEAINYYRYYSYGTSDKNMKIFRTDEKGNMRVRLNGDGTGIIYWNL